MENATILTPPKSVLMLIFEDRIDMLSPANLEQICNLHKFTL